MSTYKVKSGDTLSQIAQANGTSVSALMASNPQITNKDLIFAGANITIPQAGETPKTLTDSSTLGGDTEKTLTPLDDSKDEGFSKDLEAPEIDSGKSKTLPEGTGGLTNFADALSKSTDLARSKRNRMSLELMGKRFDPGAEPASGFAGILGDINRASTTFRDSKIDELIGVHQEEQGGDISQTSTDFQTFTFLKDSDQLPGDVNNFFEYVEKLAGVKRAPVVAGVGEVGSIGDLDLTPTEITGANALAKQIYGSSTIKTKDGYNNFVMPILLRIAAGENIDDIADDLRFKGQSVDFTGDLRAAAQQITSKLSTIKTETVFDKLDDVVAGGDIGEIRDFLKKMAIENSAGGTEQAKMIMGQERTVEFLDEIYQDLIDFEEGGGDTNIFTGTMEDVAAKVGTVKDAEMRKIAVKITKARQQYRRSMTGVAFSPGENQEYDAIFPNINRTMDFNTATIDGLREAFRGDVDFFYSFAMGYDNYQSLFKGPSDSNMFTKDEEPYEPYVSETSGTTYQFPNLF